MKLFLVQWHYHDDTMTCAVMDNIEAAEEAKKRIEEGLKINFLQGWPTSIDIEIKEYDLNAVICEEAKITN